MKKRFSAIIFVLFLINHMLIVTINGVQCPISMHGYSIVRCQYGSVAGRCQRSWPSQARELAREAAER
jgi:hypothetical protein